MRNISDELEEIDDKTDEIDNMAIFDKVDEVFDKDFATDDVRIKENYLNENTVDHGSTIATANYIKNEPEKKLDDELSELDSQEAHDAAVSELKQKIFDDFTEAYERERLANDLKSGLKETTVNLGNTSKDNYMRPVSEGWSEDVDELIEIQDIDVKYPILDSRSDMVVNQELTGEKIDTLVGDSGRSIATANYRKQLDNELNELDSEEEVFDVSEELRETFEELNEEYNHTDEFNEDNRERVVGLGSSIATDIYRRKTPDSIEYYKSSLDDFFGPSDKTVHTDALINENTPPVQVGTISPDIIVVQSESNTIDELIDFKKYEDSHYTTNRPKFENTELIGNIREEDQSEIVLPPNDDLDDYAWINTGEELDYLLPDNILEIMDNLEDLCILDEHPLHGGKKETDGYFVADDGSEAVEEEEMVEEEVEEEEQEDDEERDEEKKSEGNYKEERSKYPGPPGLFGYPSSSSYFGQLRELKRACKRGPLPGLFDHLDLKPPDFSFNGSKVKNSEETKDLDTERLLLDRETEVLTATGLVKTESLLNKTGEELKELAPFMVVDGNNEEIKFEILSADTVTVPGNTKIRLDIDIPPNDLFHPNLAMDELTIVQLFDDIDNVGQITQKDHQRLLWHRMGAEIGPYHEMRGAYESNNFDFVMKNFLEKNGFVHEGDFLIKDGEYYSLKSFEDIKEISVIDPEFVNKFTSFYQTHRMLSIDYTRPVDIVKTDIGRILTGNGGFIWDETGAKNWLNCHPEYVDAGFTDAFLNNIINMINDGTGIAQTGNLRKPKTTPVLDLDLFKFPLTPIKAKSFAERMVDAVDDPSNFIYSLRERFANTKYDISSIENIRMGRAMGRVISKYLSSNGKDVLAPNKMTEVKDFIVANSKDLDLHKLAELFKRLKRQGYIDNRKLSDFEDIIKILEVHNTDEFFEIFKKIYDEYIDLIRKKVELIYGNNSNRPIIINMEKNLEMIDVIIKKHIEIMSDEGQLAPIQLGKTLKGWLGEIDLMGRWVDQWVSTQMAKIIGPGRIGIDNFVKSLPISNQYLPGYRYIDDDKSLVKFFNNLFRNHASVSPVTNGFDLTMSIKNVDLGKLAVNKNGTMLFISEFKYFNQIALPIRKTGSSSGISFLNSADLATKFSTLDGRFNDLYKIAPPIDIDLHIRGYYDMLDQSITVARLTRNSEIRPLIARIETSDGYKFINLPLDSNRFDDSFKFDIYEENKNTINQELSDLLEEADINKVKIYPHDPNSPATLTLGSVGKYEIENPDPTWEKYRFDNRFEDPSGGAKPITVDGLTTGFIKVVDDTANICVFKDSNGIYKAWVDNPKDFDTINVDLEFRGISVTDEDELYKLFDVGQIYSTIIYKMDPDNSNELVLDTKNSIQTKLNELSDGSTNLYPRTRDRYETDKDGNFIFDDDGNLIGKKYGTKKTRDNIFEIIKKVIDDQSELHGYFYIQAGDGKEIYLSSKEEGLNVAKGRFEGIMNSNFKHLNPNNHVDKDVSYIGLPNSAINHYFRYAYNSEGKFDGSLFIHKEGIRIGGGKFDMNVGSFDDLMKSFVGLSKMERFEMAPILVNNLKRLLDDPKVNKTSLENFIDDLNELYEEFSGTGDIRQRGLAALKRELQCQLESVKKYISQRSSNWQVNNYIVDNFIAQDFVKGTNIKIKDVHDKYFKYSHRGKSPVSPFEFLLDYKNNKLYVKNVDGIRANDGITWVINPGETKVFDNLVNNNSSKIELRNLDPMGEIILEDKTVGGILKLLGLSDPRINKMLSGGLLTSFGNFLHIYRLSEFLDEFNHKTVEELETLSNNIFKARKQSSDIRGSKHSIEFDWTPKKGFTKDKNSRELGIDHTSDVLFLEYRQYMNEFRKLVDKYNHIDLRKLSIEIGVFSNFNGHEGTIKSFHDLVEYSRLQMVENLIDASKHNHKYNDGSGITTFGYLLAYYKAADYWNTHGISFREINRFASNSMLRGLYISFEEDTKAISTIIEEGRIARDLFDGETSYYDVLLGWSDVANSYFRPQDCDMPKTFPGFLNHIKQIVNNFQFRNVYSGGNSHKKVMIGSRFSVPITKNNNLLLSAFPVGNTRGKEKTIVFFYRQMLKLGYMYDVLPGSRIDSTISYYISKVLDDYLGSDYNKVLSLY